MIVLGVWHIHDLSIQLCQCRFGCLDVYIAGTGKVVNGGVASLLVWRILVQDEAKRNGTPHIGLW